MSGESGGSSRFNDDAVIGQRDLLAERESAMPFPAAFTEDSAHEYRARRYEERKAIYYGVPRKEGFAWAIRFT